jgi:hypothetical protein
MKKIFTKSSLICFLILNLIYVASAQMTPQEAIVKMNRGINIGNSLELSTEGASGGRTVQEYYFTDFKAAGFNCVRIPIRWDLHTGTTSPYTINTAWLDRVEQVVNWSLKHGLMTIINSHHDDWILNDGNYTTADLARFKAIWTQVAERFKGKSDSLMFEIGNEPNIAISKVDQINANIIPLIRSTNPTRIIIFGSSGTQLSTLKQAVIPKDKYLIASFHTYEPWDFAGNGNGTWGTTAQINLVKALMTDAAAWSSSHSNIPLFLGEFGTVGKCEINSRMKWVNTHVEEALRRNIATCVWSDFGNFGIYSHTTVAANKWNTSIRDILVFTHPLSAEALAISIANGSAQLSWKNRAAGYKWIRLDRKEGTGAYKSIDTIDGGATTYLDKTTLSGKTYTYRVACELSTGEITYSYPAEKKIVSPTAISTIEGYSDEYTAYFADGDLIVKTGLNKPEFSYRLYTLSGQTILSGRSHTNLHHINTSKLPHSTYLIQIVSLDGVTKTKKVVKY